MRLTALNLKNLKYKGKVQKIFDDALPQFGVRVYKKGISFIVMYGEKRQMKTLGKFPDVSLSEARKRAVPYLGRKTLANINLGYSEAVSTYLAEIKTTLRPSTYTQYKTSLEKAPVTGKIRNLTKQSFGDYLKSPHLAISLKVFFNWCLKNDLVESNPLLHVSVKYNEPRSRVLTPDELKAIWSALSDDPFSTIVKLLILTGQRKSEPQHFIVEKDIVTIPSPFTKNKREHVFPIGPLTQMTYQQVSFNGWSKSKARLDLQSGVTDWKLHDLRRTYATIHQMLGTPVHVVEKMLNHITGSFSGVTGVYQRYAYMDEMREAVLKYESWLDSEVLRQV